MSDTAEDGELDKKDEELQAIADALGQGFYDSEIRCLAWQIKKWNHRSRVRLCHILSKVPRSDQILAGLSLDPELLNEDISSKPNGNQDGHERKHGAASTAENTQLDEKIVESSSTEQHQEQKIPSWNVENGTSQQSTVKAENKRHKSMHDWERLEAERSALQSELQGMRKAEELSAEEIQRQKRLARDFYQDTQKQAEYDRTRFQKECQEEFQEALHKARDELKESQRALETQKWQRKCDDDKLQAMQRQTSSESIMSKEELRTVCNQLRESKSALEEVQQQKKREHEKLREVQRQSDCDRIKLQEELSAAFQDLQESRLDLETCQRRHVQDIAGQSQSNAEKEQLMAAACASAAIKESELEEAKSQLHNFEQELQNVRGTNEEHAERMSANESEKDEMWSEKQRILQDLAEHRSLLSEARELISATESDRQKTHLEKESVLQELEEHRSLLAEAREAQRVVVLEHEAEKMAKATMRQDHEKRLSASEALQSQSTEEIERLRMEMAQVHNKGEVDNVALLEHLQEVEEQNHQASAECQCFQVELQQEREAQAAQHEHDSNLRLRLRHEHEELQVCAQLAELRQFELRAEVDEMKEARTELESELESFKNCSRSSLTRTLPAPRSHLPGTEPGSLDAEPRSRAGQRAQRPGSAQAQGFSSRPPLRRPASSNARLRGLSASESAPSLPRAPTFPGSTDGNFNPAAFGNREQIAKSPMLSLVRKGSPHRYYAFPA